MGGREIGYLFGQYKRIRDSYEGVLTGKGLTLRRFFSKNIGYRLRTSVSDRGIVKNQRKRTGGKTVVVSGANVATYAIEKAYQLGAKPVTCSDSTGWVYDPDGIDVAALKDIKEVKTCTSDRNIQNTDRMQNTTRQRRMECKM